MTEIPRNAVHKGQGLILSGERIQVMDQNRNKRTEIFRQKNSILLIAQISQKTGFGHWKRLQDLVSLLSGRAPLTLSAWSLDKRIYSGLQGHTCFYSLKEISTYLQQHSYGHIILDFRYYSASAVKKLSGYSSLILLDAPCLFKTEKPSVYINSTTPLHYKYLNKTQMNYQGLILKKDSKLTVHRKEIKTRKGILISFGNSDPHGLTWKVLSSLYQLKTTKKIRVIIGKYFSEKLKRRILSSGIIKKMHPEIIHGKSNIDGEIIKSRYIITSYGLTALEASLLKKSIALLNNSPYHTKLSSFYGHFHYLGTYPFLNSGLIKARLRSFLKSGQPSPSPISILSENMLSQIFRPHSSSYIEICPVCRSKRIRLILHQDPKKFYACLSCHSKFLQLSEKQPEKKIYTDSYFNKEYKLQYGKTYREDQKNISSLASQRIKIIDSLLPGRNNRKLLDIGCAYGFFLQLAKKSGYEAQGLEIEKQACWYAKNKLKLSVQQKNFINFTTDKKYGIITLWYVFEHFSDPHVILKKINRMLNPQGLLCLALPNGNGPFYRYNRDEWLKKHPDDHFFDYSIQGLKILMKKHGFRLRYKKITGYHPERYRGLPFLMKPFFTFFQNGDTVELYFQKIR